MTALIRKKSEPKKRLFTRAKKPTMQDELTAFAANYPHIFDPNKRLLFAFFRGFCYGAGFLLAMAIAVPLMIFFLSQIQWVPMIGDIVTDVIESMHQVDVAR